METAEVAENADRKRDELSLTRRVERVGGVLGLVVTLVLLTFLWDRAWWVRVPLALLAGALLWLALQDFVPQWRSRRRGVLGLLLVLALGTGFAPLALGGMSPPTPDSAGSATITAPRDGRSILLAEREEYGFTDGFTAAGTCEVPSGYRAMIVSRPLDTTGYWLLSRKIDGCADDGVPHRWTADYLDPSWEGMPPNYPVQVGVTILREDLVAAATEQADKGSPAALPPPVAAVVLHLTRNQPADRP